MTAPAALYVVATPLGNLGDLTFRAAEVLRRVAVVAAEDTRRTRQLLHHLEAHPRLISFHAHSPESRIAEVIAFLREGKEVALVTDAGTPSVSDPGPALVVAARAAGCVVIPIPGPSAVAAALSASGLSGDRFLFLGFPPRKGEDRASSLRHALTDPWSVVFFEAANRLVALLEDLAQVAGGERRAVIARELTKLHEEIRTGTLAELAAYYRENDPKGEVTVIVEGAGEAPATDTMDLEARARELLGSGLKPREVVDQVVKESGEGRNRVYRMVMSLGREGH